MSNPQMRNRARYEGFTLIELLVVVLIIGILATIAIPAFLGQRSKANDTAAKSIVRSGVIAAESFVVDNPTQDFTGMVPSLLADHEQNVSWVSTPAQAVHNQLQVATYGSAPTAPQTSYVLASASKSGSTFVYYRRDTGAAVKCRGNGDPITWAAADPTGCGGTYADEW